jgi:hypothetical protein
MRPVAGVWMRQPHIDFEGDPDGLSIPNPAARQVTGGWMVPFVTDDRRAYGRRPAVRYLPSDRPVEVE